jgi:hypothetical protein
MKLKRVEEINPSANSMAHMNFLASFITIREWQLLQKKLNGLKAGTDLLAMHSVDGIL